VDWPECLAIRFAQRRMSEEVGNSIQATSLHRPQGEASDRALVVAFSLVVPNALTTASSVNCNSRFAINRKTRRALASSRRARHELTLGFPGSHGTAGRTRELALLKFIGLDEVIAFNNRQRWLVDIKRPLRRQDFSGTELADVARLRQRRRILTS